MRPFPGRLVESAGRGDRGRGWPGASRHVAAIILTALVMHPGTAQRLLISSMWKGSKTWPGAGWRVVSFDRAEEPVDGQSREGGTLVWGVASVLKPGPAGWISFTIKGA